MPLQSFITVVMFFQFFYIDKNLLRNDIFVRKISTPGSIGRQKVTNLSIVILSGGARLIHLNLPKNHNLFALLIISGRSCTWSAYFIIYFLASTKQIFWHNWKLAIMFPVSFPLSNTVWKKKRSPSLLPFLVRLENLAKKKLAHFGKYDKLQLHSFIKVEGLDDGQEVEFHAE